MGPHRGNGPCGQADTASALQGVGGQHPAQSYPGASHWWWQPCAEQRTRVAGAGGASAAMAASGLHGGARAGVKTQGVASDGGTTRGEVARAQAGRASTRWGSHSLPGRATLGGASCAARVLVSQSASSPHGARERPGVWTLPAYTPRVVGRTSIVTTSKANAGWVAQAHWAVATCSAGKLSARTATWPPQACCVSHEGVAKGSGLGDVPL